MKLLFTSTFFLLLGTGLMAQSLSGVESVEYDPINKQYLTSSDGTSIVAIAPNGALSYFGNGLQADYGMEVVGNTVFAIVGGSVRGYDLTSETQVMNVSISGASFLNGMASNGTDKLWVTDFSAKKIHEIDITNLGSATTGQIATTGSSTPNGIVYDGANNRCLFVTWGTGVIKEMALSNYAISTVVGSTGLTNIDGIDADGNGNWYISSWSPARITKYNNDFSSSETITVPGISNPADICYAPETDTLAIPGGNQVLFVGFESSPVGLSESESFEPYGIHYSSGYPVVKFELTNLQDVTLEIIDMSGRVAYTVLEGPQPAGAQTVVLSSIGLYSGAYVCRLTSKELSFSERIVIP
ncbi:MAG: T9SS type A sorting domain-containing protein [Flavobacteriales bacterium]|nr:T9SS type A sorting domain-containing protein [Flavobacteriales bacterium]